MIKAFEVSKNSLKTAFDPIVLRETPQTRLIALPHKYPTSGLRLQFIHQRKSKEFNEELWKKSPHFDKRLLKPGESVGLELGTEETRVLLENLPLLAQAAEINYDYGSTRVAALEDDQTIVSMDKVEELNAFRTLLENKSVEEVKTMLDSIIPEVTKRLSELKIIDSRLKVLAEFKEELEKKLWQERQWQEFFHKNQWIFGYGVHFCYLDELRKEGYCGGKDDSGSGGQYVDFIMASIMEKARFTVLVEIKTPGTSLLKRGEHRNRVYTLHDELISSVSQIQYYCSRWEREGSLQPETLKQQARKSIYTYKPKGILIIGHSEQFENDEDKFATFELYRRGLHNIDILTYDELFHRAERVANFTAQD